MYSILNVSGDHMMPPQGSCEPGLAVGRSSYHLPNNKCTASYLSLDTMRCLLRVHVNQGQLWVEVPTPSPIINVQHPTCLWRPRDASSGFM